MNTSRITSYVLLLAALICMIGCSSERPTQGWRLRGLTPIPGRESYHPDQAITDDYENFMKKLPPSAAALELQFYDSGKGADVDGQYRHAVEIITFYPHSRKQKHYFLEYNEFDRRTKVTTFSDTRAVEK